MECKKVLSYDLEGDGQDKTFNLPLALYLDSDKKCQNCRKDCSKCDDLRTCQQCKFSMYMVFNDEESTCLATCPEGYLPSVPSLVLFSSENSEIDGVRENLLNFNYDQ